MPIAIVVGPEDKNRMQDAARGLAPRVDYRLIAESFSNATVEEWYPSPAYLRGTKPSRVARSLSANLHRAMALMRQLPPNSVIYSTGETWGLPIALALMLSGASHRHVVYVHRVFTANWLALLCALRPIMKVDGWICLTEHQRRVLVRTLGSRAAPVIAISQGVDTAFYDSTSPALMAASPYILAVGAEMRNYQLLFDAVKPLDVPVVVRPSSPWLRRPRSGIGLVPSNVSLVTQPLSYVDLRNLYAGALLVAVPLRPTVQAAGITTILEAMAMGKCVVATKSRGLPDVLCDGMNGVVVEQHVAALRAALAFGAADVAWLESLGDAGRRMVRDRASLEQHASQVTAFIRQIAGG